MNGDEQKRSENTAGLEKRPKGTWLPGGLLLGLNWLAPGAGFWLAGRRARGAIQFIMVMVTFLLGLLLRAGVTWPSWSPQSQDFNLINNFTVVVQLGAGLPALFSLLAQNFSWLWLMGDPQYPYYELGGYFMIVAGAINYFAVCNLYDRIVHLAPRFKAQELGEEEAGSDS